MADVRLQIAMGVYAELLHFEVIRASGEHRSVSFEAAAEDAFRAADALLAEAQPVAVGPHALDEAPISIANGIPDTMTTMPPCVPGQKYHRAGPNGGCVFCGIDIAEVREIVTRNQNRYGARARRRAQKAG